MKIIMSCSSGILHISIVLVVMKENNNMGVLFRYMRWVSSVKVIIVIARTEHLVYHLLSYIYLKETFSLEHIKFHIFSTVLLLLRIILTHNSIGSTTYCRLLKKLPKKLEKEGAHRSTILFSYRRK